MVALAALLLLLVYAVRRVLVWIVVALFFAVALYPVADFLERPRGPQGRRLRPRSAGRPALRRTGARRGPRLRQNDHRLPGRRHPGSRRRPRGRLPALGHRRHRGPRLLRALPAAREPPAPAAHPLAHRQAQPADRAALHPGRRRARRDPRRAPGHPGGRHHPDHRPGRVGPPTRPAQKRADRRRRPADGEAWARPGPRRRVGEFRCRRGGVDAQRADGIHPRMPSGVRPRMPSGGSHSPASLTRR